MPSPARAAASNHETGAPIGDDRAQQKLFWTQLPERQAVSLSQSGYRRVRRRCPDDHHAGRRCARFSRRWQHHAAVAMDASQESIHCGPFDRPGLAPHDH